MAATKKTPKCVRVEVTKGLDMELNSYWRGPKKGTVLDGRLDREGNFHCTWIHPRAQRKERLTIYPSHFKVLGRFYFRKSTSKAAKKSAKNHEPSVSCEIAEACSECGRI
jgi:hypothetical protein